jgi:hypothetical protein
LSASAFPVSPIHALKDIANILLFLPAHSASAAQAQLGNYAGHRNCTKEQSGFSKKQDAEYEIRSLLPLEQFTLEMLRKDLKTNPCRQMIVGRLCRPLSKHLGVNRP